MTDIETLKKRRQEIIDQLQDEGYTLNQIMENMGPSPAAPSDHDAEKRVWDASTVRDIESLFVDIGLIGVKEPTEAEKMGGKHIDDPSGYKNDDTPFGLKQSGRKYREKINAQCKEVLQRVGDDPEKLTPEDREILKQYSGRGNTDEGSFYEYYTPTHVAEGVWDMLKSHGFENGNVLEPCTGSGVFLATKPAGTLVTGSEISKTSSQVAQLLHPEDVVHSQPFENLVIDTPDNTFDGCVTNVPFGDVRGAHRHTDKAYKHINQIDQYFISRIIDKLKPGKLACVIAPVSTIGRQSANGKYKAWRHTVCKKAEFLGAHKFPSDTFTSLGTDAVIDVLAFRKHPQDLLDKVNDLPLETLKETNVIWEPFVEGKYWTTPEGKKQIMGKFTSKVDGERWSREKVEANLKPAELKNKLAKRFNSRIDWAALEVAEPIHKNYTEGDRRIINSDEYEMTAGEWVKLHTVDDRPKNLDKAKYGATSFDELESLLSHPKTCLNLSCEQMWSVYKDYPDMLTESQRQCVEFAMSQGKMDISEQLYRGSIIGTMLAGYQNAVNDPAVEADDSEREVLLEIVGSEIDKYGHPKNNKRLTMTGESSRFFGLFSNAYDVRGNPSDLLSGTLETASDRMAFDSSNIQSIVEHLYLREGIQVIEMDDIKKIYTGRQKLESIGDIAEDDSIAITPDGMIEPIGKYTAGDIYPKIRAMNAAMAEETDKRIIAKWQKQIDIINQKRKKTDPETITFSMQQRWFPRKYIVDFLNNETGYNIEYGTVQEVEKENAWTGEMETEEEFTADLDTPFGEFRYKYDDKPKKFDLHFLKYLNGAKMSGYTPKDENKNPMPEAEGSVESNKQALAELTENFSAWIKQHPDIDEIAEGFNEKFNGYVQQEYDDSDLGLDVSDRFTLHGYQNAVVRRMSEEGRGIIAHNVGLGKSVEALGLCEYNRKMGRAKKTCIVVPNAVLGNWYQESKAFLGHHNNVLFVGFEPQRDKSGDITTETVYEPDGKGGQKPKLGKDGKPIIQDVLKPDPVEDIYRKMWSIPTTNFSIVVMTKERFGQIPMKQETKMKYADKMVERSLIGDKDAVEATVQGGQKAEKGMSYEDHKSQIRNEGRFSDEGTNKREELPYWEDLGFDSVMVDEGHEFKNLYKPKSETRIAYLSEPQTAQRSMDMAMKTNFMRDMTGGRGVYMLSATPVTNSAFETYSMLSYVCGHEEFDRFGIYTVDDFIRVFGKIEQVQKAGLDGKIKNVDALVGFQNLDGLRNILNKYVDLKTAEDFPEQIKLPPADHVDVSVTLTGGQLAIYRELQEQAKEAMKAMARGGSKGAMLKILRKMDRITTDIDMYYQQVTYSFRTEDRANVEQLLASMPETMTVTRMVKDQEDPTQPAKKTKVEIGFNYEMDNESTGDTFNVIIPQDFDYAFSSRFKRNNINPDDVTHPITPKYAELLENLKKEHEQGGKQIVFTEEKSQHNKLERIIVHHVPIVQKEIAIINADEAAGKKLQNISDAYNSGKVKIVIANKKAEMGVNLQKGTTAIHHLTFPWTPASIQQRNGRGVRQGNTAKHINVYYYHGKDSIDEYRLDLLRGKESWLDKLFFGEDNDMANDDAGQEDDYEIMLSDNKEEARQKKIDRLKRESEKKKAAEDKRALNLLQQVISIRQALERFDDKKEEARAKAEGKIEELQGKIDNLTQKIKDSDDDDKIAKLSGSLSGRKKDLEKAKLKLKGLDSEYETKKEEKRNQIKQKTALLRGKAKKGELPFDESLLDRPEDAVVGTDGRVIAIGDTYEIKGHERISDGTIFKITTVDGSRRTFRLETIVGDRLNNNKDIKVSAFAKNQMVKVTYSEKELNLMKILQNRYDYGDLWMGAIDFDTFKEHRDKIKFKVGTYPYPVYDEDGNIEFKEFGYSDDIGPDVNIVYPQPKSENFKKSMCIAYLESQRSGGRDYAIKLLMKSLFGDDFENDAMQYGKTATESDVRAECERLWKEMSQGVDLDERIRMIRMRDRDIENKALALGDNKAEIEGVFDRFLSEINEKHRQEGVDNAQEEERRKVEELKNHPDYKEVPENIKSAFEQIGIKVKINMTTIVNDGGRYKSQSFQPFSRYFLNDSSGKNGRLYRVKEVLKSRFNASFANPKTGEITGPHWHVPSSTDLADLYKLIA